MHDISAPRTSKPLAAVSSLCGPLMMLLARGWSGFVTYDGRKAGPAYSGWLAVLTEAAEQRPGATTRKDEDDSERSAPPLNHLVCLAYLNVILSSRRTTLSRAWKARTPVLSKVGERFLVLSRRIAKAVPQSALS